MSAVALEFRSPAQLGPSEGERSPTAYGSSQQPPYSRHALGTTGLGVDGCCGLGHMEYLTRLSQKLSTKLVGGLWFPVCFTHLVQEA